MFPVRKIFAQFMRPEQTPCLQEQYYHKTAKFTKKEQKTLKKRLSSVQYRVTQKGKTEKPYTGAYYSFFEDGLYSCVCCQQPLFSSESKYLTGAGWPMFFDVLDKRGVCYYNDFKKFYKRTAVKCSKCYAHLGYVFRDGPPPTYTRFCINSASLRFTPDENYKIKAIMRSFANYKKPPLL